LGVSKDDPVIKLDDSGRCINVFYVEKSEDLLIPLRDSDESDLKFSRVIGHTLPRVLLRRSANLGGGERDFIFMRFSDMIKECLDSSSKLDLFSIFKNEVQREEKYHGFKREIIEEISKLDTEKMRKYAIFICLFLRIHFSMLFLEYENFPQTTPYEKYLLMLFVDTHLDLSIEIIENDLYENDFLLDTDYNRHDEYWPLLAFFYPHDTRFKNYENMASMWQYLYKSGTGGDFQTKNNEYTIYDALSHCIFTKSEIYTYQKRSLSQMLISTFLEFPDLCTIVNSIIAISLLGNTLETNYYPNFETKLRIYNTFYKSQIPTFLILKRWLEIHEKLSLFCIRNFYLYHIDTDYVHDNYSNLDEKWKYIRHYIILANDDTRRFISENSQNQDSIFDKFFIDGIETVITKYYLIVLKYSVKITKADTIQIFHQKLFQLYKDSLRPSYKKNEEKKSTENERKKTFEIGTRTYGQILSIVNFIHDSGFLHTNQYIDIYWLKTLGLEKSVYYRFLECYYSYIFEYTPENSITKKIRPILNRNPRDFSVIRIFFEELYKKKSNLTYLLPENIRNLQIQALRRKSNFLPWENLNETFDLSYYCQNCKKWANHVALPNSKKSKKHLGSITPQKSSLNALSGEIVCYKNSEIKPSAKSKEKEKEKEKGKEKEKEKEERKITKNSKRDGNENDDNSEIPSSLMIDGIYYEYYDGDYIDEEEEEIMKEMEKCNLELLDEKIMNCEHERKRRLYEKFKCGITPLECINMIGVIKTLKNKMYIKCTICNSIIEYDSSKVGMYGITCCNHFDYERDYYQFLNRMKRYSPENLRKCFYCNNYKSSSDKSKNIHTLQVLDEQDSFSIKKIHVCNFHFEMISDNRQNTGLFFPFMSNIRNSIMINPNKIKNIK